MTDSDPLVAALSESSRLRERIAALEAEKPPCDAGCRDYPEEECSRHGRKVAEVWDALGIVQADRDRLREQLEAVRGLAEAAFNRGATIHWADVREILEGK